MYHYGKYLIGVIIAYILIMLFSGGMYEFHTTNNKAFTYKMNKLTGDIQYCVTGYGCKSIDPDSKSMYDKILDTVSNVFSKKYKTDDVVELQDAELIPVDTKGKHDRANIIKFEYDGYTYEVPTK